MKLGWYVFVRRKDGGVMPVAGFWRKRTALRWAAENAEPGQRLEVHRFGWWSTHHVAPRTTSTP